MQPHNSSLLKEYLYLNKIFLAATVIWAFIIAYVAAVKSLQTDCGSLYNISVVGLALGFTAVIVDFILEVFQDSAYFCPNSGEKLRKAFNVPDEYDGFTCFYFSNKDDDAQTKPHWLAAWFLFFFEALLRVTGNIALFWLYVLASFDQWSNSSTPTCEQAIFSWLHSNYNSLFWVVAAFTFARLIVAFSYADRQTVGRQDRVSETLMEISEQLDDIHHMLEATTRRKHKKRKSKKAKQDKPPTESTSDSDEGHHVDDEKL